MKYNFTFTLLLQQDPYRIYSSHIQWYNRATSTYVINNLLDKVSQLSFWISCAMNFHETPLLVQNLLRKADSRENMNSQGGEDCDCDFLACPSAGHWTTSTIVKMEAVLFQNKHQQDDTYGLSFISWLVVLYSTCFELQGAHHQEFTFSTLYRQSLAYCITFCCIPPVLLRVLLQLVTTYQTAGITSQWVALPMTRRAGQFPLFPIRLIQ